MSDKYLVTLRSADDASKVRAAKCEILAEYPDTLLVRCNDAQKKRLQKANLEMSAIESPAVTTTGMSFAMSSAVEAEAVSPVEIDQSRTAYYLIQLAGPPTADWLQAIKTAGGQIYGTLAGYTYLIGILPAGVQNLSREPWVEAITPYRAAMKVSPHLRPGVSRSLGVSELESVTIDAPEGDARKQIEVNVFPNESTAHVAAKIRDSGGIVISETPTTVVASVAPNTITEVANEPGVQAILPFSFPEFHNDRATVAMGAAANRVFADLELRGTGQIVGVADSGLDTGVAATLHNDIRGRVASLTSMPTDVFFRQFTNDVAPFDDGAADTNSAHGTHVAGSVLGNGAEAVSAGSAFVPRGMAPDAQICFQAIEQRINWKTLAQINAAGLDISWWTGGGQPWPPPAFGLFGLPNALGTLFTGAYTAGARIHTNSWGSNVAGVYNANSRAVDSFMFQNRDMLILFSAGNSGRDNNGNGVIDPDSMGSPGTAKNCLNVGATENNRPAGSTPTPGINANWSVLGSGAGPTWPNLGPAGHVSDNIEGMAAFSSRGPCDDGRIKPDLVAPGTNILSVRSSVHAGPGAPLWGDLAATEPLNGRYCWSGGTSMSTPLVAGAAALVRQHLVQQRGHSLAGVKPSGALIKAMLVNGAVPITGQFAGEIPAAPPTQNSVEGFGRVNVAESITPNASVAAALHRTLFADEPQLAVSSGEMRTFQVQAVDPTLPLKVTLVWTDAPAPSGVGGLINTLYLQVVEPGGTVRNGDVAAFPTVNNNVQQVIIPAPLAAGTFEIRVRGVSVVQHAPSVPAGPSPRQDFALAVSNVMGPSLQPVSIAQAIDTTGSMAVFGFIEPAKERAKQFCDFLRSTDTLSITEFSHRTGPDARTIYTQRVLASFNPDWTAAHTAVDTLIANGLTPIGAGLLGAWNQLNVPLTAGMPRAIVLLSDGINTFPPAPNDPSVLPTIPASVPIFTIALGPASSTPTLQTIANSRPGGGYFEVYTDDDIHRLHEIYAALQALAAGAAGIGLDSAEVAASSEADHEMPVENGNDEVTFTLSWSDPGRQVALIVTGPDGRSYNATTAATAENKGKSYHMVRVAAPKAGKWKLTVSNRNSKKPVKYTISGAVQTSLKLSAKVTQAGTDRLVVSASLRRGPKPISDAKVVARISLPSATNSNVLAQFKDRLDRVKLPEGVDESGLKEDERLLTKLAVFAMEFRNREGGLFGRKIQTLELTPQGDGEWGGRFPIAVPGNARVEIIASGNIGGQSWRRVASQSLHISQSVESTDESGRIKSIFARKNKGLRFVEIGAKIVKDSGKVATPEDGVKVNMMIKQKTKTARTSNLPYQNSAEAYIWQFAESGFKTGEAELTVEATRGSRTFTSRKKVKL